MLPYPPDLRPEKPGQTLNAIARVHEAYLRLADVKAATEWVGNQ